MAGNRATAEYTLSLTFRTQYSNQEVARACVEKDNETMSRRGYHQDKKLLCILMQNLIEHGECVEVNHASAKLI